MSARAPPQAGSSRSPKRGSPRSLEASPSASVKRRHRAGATATPRQVVALDELLSSVGKDLRGTDSEALGVGASAARGVGTGTGKKGARKSGRLANRVETPRGMLKQLANELPPPTPNLAPSSSEEEDDEAPAGPEKPDRSAPPGPGAVSARSARTGASLSSPAGRTDGLRSDDDVFAQLVPGRRPLSLSNLFFPPAPASLANLASPGGLSSGDGQDTFERAVRRDALSASRRPVETAAGKRPSGASEVESQMGRGRISSLGGRTSLGVDHQEDDDGGGSGRMSGIGRDGDRFDLEDNRIFRASASPGRNPLGPLTHLSSPLRTQQTLSSLSSPGAGGDPSEADMDIDVPLDDDDEEDDSRPPVAIGGVSTSTVSAGARFGARAGPGSTRAVSGREVSMSLDGDMDMDLGTEDDDEAPPLVGATVDQGAREATPLLGAPPSPEPEVEDEAGMGATEADLSGVMNQASPVPEEREGSPPLRVEARAAAEKEARRRLSVDPAVEQGDREFRPDEVPEEDDDDDVIDLGLLDDLAPKPKTRPNAGRDEASAPTASRRQKRPQRYTASGLPLPELPRGLVKALFGHFAGGPATRLAPDGLDGLMDASHAFLATFMADCASVARGPGGERGGGGGAGGRGKTRVTEADAVEVLKGMGLLNEKTTLQSLGRRFGVPKEVQGVLDGIRTEGKRRQKAGPRRRERKAIEEEEEEEAGGEEEGDG